MEVRSIPVGIYPAFGGTLRIGDKSVTYWHQAVRCGVVERWTTR